MFSSFSITFFRWFFLLWLPLQGKSLSLLSIYTPLFDFCWVGMGSSFHHPRQSVLRSSSPIDPFDVIWSIFIIFLSRDSAMVGSAPFYHSVGVRTSTHADMVWMSPWTLPSPWTGPLPSDPLGVEWWILVELREVTKIDAKGEWKIQFSLQNLFKISFSKQFHISTLFSSKHPIGLWNLESKTCTYEM